MMLSVDIRERFKDAYWSGVEDIVEERLPDILRRYMAQVVSQVWLSDVTRLII